MGRIDEIIAKQKELAEELELAKQQERDAVLKDIKEKIKMFDFKASDFKGMFKSRVTQKQVEDFLKRKEADKSKPKVAAKKTTSK
jgi:23S rRNA A1618 N6-methylase RlmF